MKRILTGLQPTGIITLGNYIGAIKQMVNYQNDYEAFIFVADLHSLTISPDPKILKENIRRLLALYLACGIDPDKNTIFIQSENLYHANLGWVLECNSYFGELSRMHQFKEKSKNKENFSVGLFTYPALMAADILLYDIDYVPVGIDQKQHVEITRDLAIRFNNKYGDTFKVPDILMSDVGTKIKDLVNPEKKMSKTGDNPKGIISLLDSDDEIRKKIMSATTDSEMVIKYDEENKPGISNLINIYASLKGVETKEVEEKFSGYNYGDFKKEVASVVIEEVSKIRIKYEEIIKSDLIDKVLDDGLKRVNELALKKYELVKEKLGIKR